MPEEKKIITAFHGTSAYSVDKIKKNNFILSDGKDEWYGKGVYFFVEKDGPFKPEQCAKMWSEDRRYGGPTVLMVELTLKESEILDLDCPESWKAWTEYENVAIERLKSAYKARSLSTEEKKLAKKLVNNWIYENIKIDYNAVIARSHVKFGERKYKDTHLRPSFVPNCCIMCVYNPCGTINVESIKKVRV